jgi:hypothetical protein
LIALMSPVTLDCHQIWTIQSNRRHRGNQKWTIQSNRRHRGNQKWTIQSNRRYRGNQKWTTQYVLDTTIHKIQHYCVVYLFACLRVVSCVWRYLTHIVLCICLFVFKFQLKDKQANTQHNMC